MVGGGQKRHWTEAVVNRSETARKTPNVVSGGAVFKLCRHEPHCVTHSPAAYYPGTLSFLTSFLWGHGFREREEAYLSYLFF
jgi:hypothetical protein